MGAVNYVGRIYGPAVNSLCGKVIIPLNDNPGSGYVGARNTTELVASDFYWPAIDSDICKYVSGCEGGH
jgi:hypothetical protein